MVDIDILTKLYFYFDKPVPYKLQDKTIQILPIKLPDSMIFLSSVEILTIEKNNFSSVEIIRMSYLEFICKVLLEQKDNINRLLNILVLCLGLQYPEIRLEEDKPYIYDSKLDIKIDSKNFDEIKKIILHQNILNYDDEYINPDLKKSMEEIDELKTKNLVIPSLERQIAMISSHTGITKEQQLNMTLRSHTLLFNEVRDENKYLVTMPVALRFGQSDKVEDWALKKRKDKFDGYITSVESYTKSMGGNSAIKTTNSDIGSKYENVYDNFNKQGG